MMIVRNNMITTDALKKRVFGTSKKKYLLVGLEFSIIIIITIAYVLSFILAKLELFLLSGLIFIGLGIGLFAFYFKATKNYLNSRGIYLLLWLTSIGLACMKLHPMQVQWKNQTWICLWLSTCLFIIGYSFTFTNNIPSFIIKDIRMSSFNSILIISCVILMVFLFEVAVFGGIPMFSHDMSAYHSFALPFLHYITVSCVLIAPMTIIHLYTNRSSKIEKYILLLDNIIMFMIPLLIVSRQLLLMGLIFIFFTFLELHDTSKIPIRYLLYFVTAMVVAWIFLTKARHQSDEYIRYVFKLDDKMSVPLYRVYMYIAFNFDNFNDIVGRIEGYSYFLYSLNPLLTFTGTKGIVTKMSDIVLPERFLPVYTTYPYIIAPYKDLGVIGVVIYSIAIGYFTGIIEMRNIRIKTSKTILSHTVLNYCLIFSFFTSFLSNTSIWGYFIVIFLFSSLAGEKPVDKSFGGIIN